MVVIMVYKPTNITGGPILYNHKVLTCKILNQPIKLAMFAYNVLQPWVFIDTEGWIIKHWEMN